MENLFYILAVIAYFLFQGYQNFKKEQEKAKKRNLGKPVEAYGIPEEVESEPLIEKRTEAIDLKPDYKLTNREIQLKEKIEESVYKKMDYKSLGDYYNPEKPAIENKPLKVQTKSTEVFKVQHKEDDIIDFDLRDAVIKEAILKRPY